MLEAKSLRKAMVPCSLLEHPSPGSVQSTRLALHVLFLLFILYYSYIIIVSIKIPILIVFLFFTLLLLLLLLSQVNADHSSCWVYIASGCRIYKLQISMQDSLVNQGKESLLIPEQTQVCGCNAFHLQNEHFDLASFCVCS
ncbi:hypothetical protein CsSME_00014577 [Camellia sinensis var. sinensis]